MKHRLIGACLYQSVTRSLQYLLVPPGGYQWYCPFNWLCFPFSLRHSSVTYRGA